MEENAQSPAKADIRHQGNNQGGRYFVPLGKEEAELTYRLSDEGRTMIIDHTLVPGAHRGKGLATLLVERAVSDAREAGREITPLCWFARQYLEKHAGGGR